MKFTITEKGEDPVKVNLAFEGERFVRDSVLIRDIDNDRDVLRLKNVDGKLVVELLNDE